MRSISEADRARALELIRILRDPDLDEVAAEPLFVELERLLVHPRVTDLMFWEEPELTDEEVIDKALEYEPFAL